MQFYGENYCDDRWREPVTKPNYENSHLVLSGRTSAIITYFILLYQICVLAVKYTN